MKWRELLEEIEEKINKEREISKTEEIDFADLKKFSEDIAALQKKIFELDQKSIKQDIMFEKIRKELSELSILKEDIEYSQEKISKLEKRVEEDLPKNLLHLEKKINILPELVEEKIKAITAERFEVVKELDKRLDFLEEQVDRAFATMGFVKKSSFLQELKRKIENIEKSYSTLSEKVNKLVNESKLPKKSKEKDIEKIAKKIRKRKT
ncbi:MAG: hypothetical protein J7J15_00980 [Candidatus Aenigmarchaeota archaeon]|nr:hypothetical protein [Candidatus Aenigmarchaeota archaeon]